MVRPLSAAAQTTGGAATAEDRASAHSVSGVLLDPSGAAIPKAQVTLLGGRGEVMDRTTTDAVGAFHFNDISPGKFTLEFHADGFRDTRISPSVLAKRFVPLRVAM